MLGLCCCAWVISSCGEQGLLFVVVRGLLIGVASLVAVASLVVEHSSRHAGSVVAACRPQSMRAQ